MKSLIKKITIGLVLFGLCCCAFAQGNGVVDRYYKGDVDGVTAEMIFMEDNICLLVATDPDYGTEYLACKYLYVPAKNIGFLWEDEEDYLDFDYADYILLEFNDAKGTLKMSMDDESYTLKLVK